MENGYGCGANHGIHPRGGHCYPEACNGVLCKEKVAMQATALALKEGQCDINSGDTYNNFALKAVAAKVKLGQLQHFLAVFAQECMGQLPSFGPP